MEETSPSRFAFVSLKLPSTVCVLLLRLSASLMQSEAEAYARDIENLTAGNCAISDIVVVGLGKLLLLCTGSIEARLFSLRRQPK